MTGTTQLSPPVHYIWAGPPPTGNNSPMATIGPDLMIKKDPSRDLHYWCLSAYVEHYTKHFQKSLVTVHAIEPYVEKRNPELYVLINKIKEAALFSSTASDTARHYVTIKELVQYFLPITLSNDDLASVESIATKVKDNEIASRIDSHKLSSQADNSIPLARLNPIPLLAQLTQIPAPALKTHGYFLDTNILPCPHVRACNVLPALAYYSIPKTAKGVDPFIQYSPQNESQQSSEARFNYYFKEAGAIYSEPSNTNDRISIYSRLQIIQAFVRAGEVVKVNLRYLTAESIDKDLSLHSVGDIGVEKRFWNTHKHNASSQIPPAFYTVLTDHATDELRYMIAYGLDVNAIFEISSNDDKDDIYPTCLAYQAILENKEKQLEVLLEHISDFDTAYDGPLYIGSSKLTLLQLAKSLNHTECISFIYQAKMKQHGLNLDIQQAIDRGKTKRLKELLAVFPDLNITLPETKPPLTVLALAEQSGDFESMKQIYLEKIKRCIPNKNDDERLALILQQVSKARRCSIFTWCFQQDPISQAKNLDEILTEVVKNPKSKATKAINLFLKEPAPAKLRSEFSCPSLGV